LKNAPERFRPGRRYSGQAPDCTQDGHRTDHVWTTVGDYVAVNAAMEAAAIQIRPTGKFRMLLFRISRSRRTIQGLQTRHVCPDCSGDVAERRERFIATPSARLNDLHLFNYCFIATETP